MYQKSFETGICFWQSLSVQKSLLTCANDFKIYLLTSVLPKPYPSLKDPNQIFDVKLAAVKKWGAGQGDSSDSVGSTVE